MKCRISTLSNKQKKELDQIIADQSRVAVVQAKESFYPKLEAMILWTLHSSFGFGVKRLIRFREKFKVEFDRMCERYEMDDCYPMIAKLKAMGIDVEKMVDDDELKEVTK